MSYASTAKPRLATRERVGSVARARASQLAITAAFLLLWLTFVVLAPEVFLSERIYLSFAQTTPYFAITALLLTMVIIAGDIDLSFPSIMALGMVGFVLTWQATGSVELGVLVALGVGALAGLFNGLLVTIVGLPAIVVTIGTQFLYRGLALVLVAGHTISLVEARDSWLFGLFVGRPFLNIPMEFFWLCLIAVFTWLLLNRHRVGQSAYAIGDNRQAATLMGVPVRRTRVLLFVLVGVAAAFAAILNSFRVVNFFPAMGPGFMLPALASVFVGGTSVFGGRGSVYGTFLGAFMIGAIAAGIVAAGLSEFYVPMIYGAIVLIAVSIHAVLQRRFAE
jgi:simple sugar transport system permease protein